MTAKTIFRIFTFAPTFSRAAAQNSAQTSKPSDEQRLAGSEISPETVSANNLANLAACVQVAITDHAETPGRVSDDLDFLSSLSTQRTCRDCGSPLDPFGDCPRMDPLGRETESAPRYCEPNVIHWNRKVRRGQGARVQAAAERRSARL
jgi:hypothetical protein